MVPQRLFPSALLVVVALISYGCMGGDPTCPSGLDVCSDDICADLQRDVENCGTCGHKCGPGLVCGRGTCNCTGFNVGMCNGQCVDFEKDLNNCGGCGVVCTAAQMCFGASGCVP